MNVDHGKALLAALDQIVAWWATRARTAGPPAVARRHAEALIADLATVTATARAEKVEAVLASKPEPPEQEATEAWRSFECFACLREFGDSGLVFDVRLPASMDLPTAKCPRCGAVCDKPQVWGATDGGYGSRGDGGLVERVRELEARFKRGDTATLVDEPNVKPCPGCGDVQRLSIYPSDSRQMIPYTEETWQRLLEFSARLRTLADELDRVLRSDDLVARLASGGLPLLSSGGAPVMEVVLPGALCLTCGKEMDEGGTTCPRCGSEDIRQDEPEEE